MNGTHPAPPHLTIRGRGRGRGTGRGRGGPIGSRGSHRGRRSREAIRKQLATSSTPQAESSLSICFVNESLYLAKGGKETPTSTDSSSDEDALPAVEDDLEKLSAQYIAKNNISRRKNHVIIPLTPSPSNSDFNSASERNPSLEGKFSPEPALKIGEEQAPVSTSPGLYFDVGAAASNTFAAYVHKIQVDARENLKRAKLEAKTSLALDRDSRDFTAEVVRLLGLKLNLNSSRKNRKLNRHVLTNLNIAQLQVILNFLLSKIENLNEKLVEYLMVRDELVMEQDSLLTDIEDITKGIASTSIVISD